MKRYIIPEKDLKVFRSAMAVIFNTTLEQVKDKNIDEHPKLAQELVIMQTYLEKKYPVYRQSGRGKIKKG